MVALTTATWRYGFGLTERCFKYIGLQTERIMDTNYPLACILSNERSGTNEQAESPVPRLRHHNERWPEDQLKCVSNEAEDKGGIFHVYSRFTYVLK